MSIPTKSPVGLVGLGKMGLELGRALIDRKFSVVGFDLDPSRRQEAAVSRLEIASDENEVFRRASIVMLSLPAAENVGSVVQAAYEVLNEGDHRTIIVDTSTSDPEVSRKLAGDLEKLGHGFLDAPVSGGPSGARSGNLTMMVGGKETDLARVTPVLEKVASKIVYVGPSGAGNVAKLINNLLVAVNIIATTEGLQLARATGVSGDAVLGVVNAATGRSVVSEIHFPEFILSKRFDSGFTMGLMRKDVRLALDLAAAMNLELPLVRLVAELWRDSIDRLSNDDDFTRMAARIIDDVGTKDEVQPCA